jgi:hypothetical protein
MGKETQQRISKADSIFSANLKRAQRDVNLEKPVFEQDVDRPSKPSVAKPDLTDSGQESIDVVNGSESKSFSSISRENIGKLIDSIKGASQIVRREASALPWNTNLRDVSSELDSATQDLQGIYEQMEKFNIFG